MNAELIKPEAKNKTNQPQPQWKTATQQRVWNFTFLGRSRVRSTKKKIRGEKKRPLDGPAPSAESQNKPDLR